MKKSLAIFALAVTMISCNKEQAVSTSEFKVAYIDTAKLMSEYTESTDLEAKYKAKSQEEARKFEVQEANFKADVEYFQKNAQSNGQAWAQQKDAELQRKQQQLQYAAQSVGQKIQMDHATELDTLVKSVKAYIKDYGKKQGYDYILGTGDASTVLFAKDPYDITAEVTKLLNDKYKSSAKKEETTENKDTKETKK